MSADIEERFSSSANAYGVHLVRLTPQIAGFLVAPSAGSLAGLDALRNGGPVDRLGPGDAIAISVYETAPGLFTNLQRLVLTPEASTSAENLPRMLIDRSGMITLPFAGRLHVAGLTPTEVERLVVDALAGKASQPQAIVNVVQNQTNIAYVTGDVRNPGRIPLSLAREHLLDALALVGGPTRAPGDSLVRVTRQGHTVSTPLVQVLDGTPENITLEPQDRIQVSYDPRSFTVFGATGRVAQVGFDTPGVNLAEALARAGGLDDNRADPDALYLFRYENSEVAHAIGIDTRDADPVPVVYRADMEDPMTMFVAQRVAMRHRDLLFVANARSVPLSKFLGLLGQAFSPVAATKALAQ